MYRSNTNTEIEILTKNLPTNKSPGPEDFKGEFYWTFRERVSAYSSETVSKCHRGRTTSQFILWGHHHPDTKTSPHKKRKLQANITNEHRCKNLQQNTTIPYLKIH